MGFFNGLTAVIATKHNKEKAIAPIVEKELGLTCVTIENFDTDVLGTFSGEIERVDDPITTLRKKCQMAIDRSGISIAIASEGSFGPHPTFHFTPADDEWVMLYDPQRGIEILGRALSLETNFAGETIHSVTELTDFAQKIGFPSHGIILKKAKTDYSVILKDHHTLSHLVQHYQHIKDENGRAYAETDMRAMNNPTRMKVIAQATTQLVQKANSLCNDCSMPGFGVVESISGLPCAACGLPTKSTWKHVYRCTHCSFEKELIYPHSKQLEDPQFCDFCNP